MAKDLRTFLDAIRDREGELVTIDRPIDPGAGEVTALLTQLDERDRRPVTLFTAAADQHGETSPVQLISNVFATRERCAVALDVDPATPGVELSREFGRRAGEKIAPVTIEPAEAPVRQNVWTGDELDVGRLPIVRHFELDHGPTLTMAHIMKSPEGFFDISFAKTFYTWHPRHMVVSLHTRDLARMVREAKERDEPARIVNVLGHHPAFYLGSLARNAWGDNDYETLGSFLGEPLRLTPSHSWGDEFLVPADAELIIEAEIPPGELDVCDPFGEVARLYQAQCLRPSFEITAITFRDGPIMQDVFSGYADSFPLGALVKESSLEQVLRPEVPNLRAIHVPDSGCGVYAVYLSVDEVQPGQVEQLARASFAAFGVVQLVVVVDGDIDVFDESQVLWAMHTYTDLRSGMWTLGTGSPDDRPEIAGAPNSGFGTTNWGGKLVFDATRPRDFAFGQRSRVAPEVMSRVRLSDFLPGL